MPFAKYKFRKRTPNQLFYTIDSLDDWGQSGEVLCVEGPGNNRLPSLFTRVSNTELILNQLIYTIDVIKYVQLVFKIQCLSGF